MLVENYQSISSDDFIKNKSNFQLLFLTSLQVVLAILWISFFAYGFSPQFSEYIATKLAWLPETAAAMRSAGIFLLMWTILIQFLIIWQLPVERKSYFFYFNWTLIGGIVGIVYLLREINFAYFKPWFKNIFASDPELKQTFHRKSWQYIMIVCLMVFMVQTIWCCFYIDPNSIQHVYSFNKYDPNYIIANNYSGIWFTQLRFFTIQTNLLCFFFALLFTIKPSLKIFRHNSFLMYCTIYIILVGLIFNCVLLPPRVSTGEVAGWAPWHWYTNIILHILDPLFFGVTGFVVITNNRKYATTNLINHLVYGMLIPFVYLTYATFSSLVAAAPVYEGITNLNPFVLVLSEDLNSFGHVWRIVYLPIFMLVFAGCITGIYFVDKHCSKKYVALPINGNLMKVN